MSNPVPPPAAYPPQPYYWAPPKPFSGWAITGFIASLLTIGLIGLPLSIVGLIDTGRGNKRGTGLAVAGTVLGLFWAAVNVVFLSNLIGGTSGV